MPKLTSIEEESFLAAKRRDPDGKTKTLPYAEFIELLDELTQLRARRDADLAKQGGQ